jgi:hypothetical protein
MLVKCFNSLIKSLESFKYLKDFKYLQNISDENSLSSTISCAAKAITIQGVIGIRGNYELGLCLKSIKESWSTTEKNKCHKKLGHKNFYKYILSTYNIQKHTALRSMEVATNIKKVPALLYTSMNLCNLYNPRGCGMVEYCKNNPKYYNLIIQKVNTIHDVRKTLYL